MVLNADFFESSFRQHTYPTYELFKITAKWL